MVLAKKDIEYNKNTTSWKRNRSSNRSRKNRSLRRMLACVLIVVLAVVLFVFYLNHNMYFFQLNYQLQDIREEISALQREKRQLELERSQLASLERIENIARKELGLVKAERVEYVYVSPESLLAEGTGDEERALARRLGESFGSLVEGFSRAEAGVLTE